MDISKDQPESGVVPNPFSSRVHDKVTWIRQSAARIESEKRISEDYPYAYGQLRGLIETAAKLLEESDPVHGLQVEPYGGAQTTIQDALDDATGQGRR